MNGEFTKTALLSVLLMFFAPGGFTLYRPKTRQTLTICKHVVPG